MCRLQKQLRLSGAERKLVEADLLESAACSQAGDAQLRHDPGSERNRRTVCHVVHERREQAPGLVRVQEIDVVENQQIPLAARRHGPQTAPGSRHPRGVRRRAERREQARIQHLDPRDRRKHVPEEDDGIAVACVQRDPRDRTSLGRGPLREQRGLAVSRGRGHEHRARCIRASQPLVQRRPRHDTRPECGLLDLRLENPEVRVRERADVARRPRSSPDYGRAQRRVR